jgi:phosphoglycerate dehydrogenase-like enzyme
MSNAPIIVTDLNFDPSSLQLLREAAQTEVAYYPNRQAFLTALQEVEILCSYNLPADLLDRTPQLRWLQYPGAGIDKLDSVGLLDPQSKVIVTSASGIHIIQISEYVFGSMLAFNRSWPDLVHLQDRHIWPQHSSEYQLRQRELSGQTLGIVGLGSIGRRIARLGRAFDMKILGTRFSVSPNESDPDADRIYPIAELHTLLSQCDYVVLAIPLTARTEKLIGEAELRAMPRHAYLINIARGRVIDEAALIHALQEGWIAGAGLDVAVDEPLPADSPLFTAPNLLLTPHISGASDHYNERLAVLFADNLRRYRSGQPLLNQYKAERGY